MKVDKSFVIKLLDSESNKSIAKSIIQLADAFELSVQANGIESIKHYEYLKKMGCDLFQGYYFTKPLSTDEFIEYIKEYKKTNPN